MYSHTRKVGSLGRYGPRLGRKVREEIKKVEDDALKNRACPTCGSARVKRQFAGSWKCATCSAVFTAGAFTPKTRKSTASADESAKEK
ncbi:50S ribosomal protein L37Ae [uncultured archaeon]|nr:50S ribosomal protein L37Ae [uncultured archaeon]